MSNDLRITFLGTGTSIGVPSIGCDCSVCLSSDPRNKRLRSSIYVEARDGLSWVVDTGPDFRTQCLRAGIRHLDAVLYSHAHMDHIVGFDDLRRFTIGQNASLPIYGTASCLADLRRMFGYAFDGENRYTGYIKPDPREVRGPFALGKTIITPLPVTHGKVETIGYLFCTTSGKRFAYISDCKTLSDDALRLLGGVEVIVIDALRHREHPTHMNFSEALALVLELGPGRVWFTHFSCEVDHEKAEAALPKNVALAYDGLQIDL